MDKQQHTEHALLDSRQALNLYLDSLFREPDIPEIELKSKKIFEEPFEVMFIKLGQHQLAIPVIEINNVINIQDKPLSQMPEQADYQFGLAQYRGRNIPVINIEWMFNVLGKLQSPPESTAKDEIHFAVVLEGERLALGCTEAEQIHQISPEDVTWNESNKRYPWRSGILREKMTVLLNIQQLKRLFGRELRQRKP